MASDMLKLPAQHIWLDYDKEADVLYMSFRKPQRAVKTIEMDNDILVNPRFPKRRCFNSNFRVKTFTVSFRLHQFSDYFN